MADTIITATVGTGTQYQVGGTGNVYYFNGAQPTDFKFPWVAGAVLRVDQSNATNDNHPFLFTTSASTNTATMRAGIITNNVEYYLDGSASQADYMNTTTFNAATTRWIEITITAPSVIDFYFACWIHGISMGGIIDITQTTWGAMNWGQGAWNKQGDEAVSLTGLQMTGTLNAAGVNVAQFPGWGTLDWGENGWGTVESAVFNLTGLSATTSVGSLSPDDQIMGLTGLSAQTDIGSLTAFSDHTLTLPALSLTSSPGLLSVDDHSVGLPGLSATSVVGNILPADVIGITAPSAAQTEVGYITISSNPVIDLTGVSASTSLGSLTIDNNTKVTLSALSATSALGSLTTTQLSITSLVGLGQVATSAVGEVIVLGYQDIDIIGNTSYSAVNKTNSASYSDVDLVGETSYTDVTHVA